MAVELVDKKGTAYLQGIQGLNYLGKMSGYKKPMNILKSYLKTDGKRKTLYLKFNDGELEEVTKGVYQIKINPSDKNFLNDLRDELEDNGEIKDLKDLANIKSPIKKIILDWCNDDKGRNVIYKKNGEERYPEFKLYKMIVRTVHKHIPREVIKHPYFNKYIVKKVKRIKSVIDIDNIPSMQ